MKGKLVYCELAMWGADSAVKGSGGVGTVIQSEQFSDTAQIFMAPATMVNLTIAQTILSYMQSSR